ncbi:retinol dehydrogenase 7-like [Rhipicephalus sanguineus]|uniref:retinol dehydrogenase 7-like n=1 Tax=Rhipicephalus sanguineus TaxID=34632 RepID=UPI0018937446|nr:retinol dehydrogenase 7-like [Rhipicephalus sanguineus]
MQGYAIMLLAVIVFRFRVLYMAPLVQTAAHTISLALVIAVASHYAAVRLLKVLTNKGVPSKGRRVITRCDSGYGNRLALELDRRGFTVVGGCVSEGSPGSPLHKEQRNIHVVDTDVTQTESLAELEKYVRALCKDDSHLWAVIINLGVVSLGELEWYDDHDMRWRYEVNVLCVARTARVFLSLPRKTPYCDRRFVILNSVGSRVAVLGTGPYCMSKYAVRCFIEVLLRELLKFGIYVVGIEPNQYRLPQTEPSSRLKSYECMWNKLPNDVKNIYSKGYADEMEENIRRAIATEPDPIVLDVAKEMLDAVQAAHPGKIYRPDSLSWKILYAGFRLLPDEITDFWCTHISGLMKSELKMILRLCDD